MTATVLSPGIIYAVGILIPFTLEEPRASRNKGYGFWAAKEKPGRVDACRGVEEGGSW